MKGVEQRMERFLRELSEAQWLERESVRDWEIERADYAVPGRYDGRAPYPQGRELDPFPSKQGTTYFFRRKLELPGEWLSSGALVGLLFESGGEGLLRVNGVSAQGLDRNHTFAPLDPARVGTSPQVEIELFDPVPEPVDPLNRQANIQPPIAAVRSELVKANRSVQSLLYAAAVVRDSALLLAESDLRRTRMLEALYRAMDGWTNLDEASVREGSAVAAIEAELTAAVRAVGGNAEGTLQMVGQSHIDVAWLWPVRETVRKTSRTFSTVDALMREYPEFKYAQSQPQLFAFLKDNDPELFERVKERVAEGRWELVGGMWVEPDLNIPSGESLMRQMLYGQRFYREEFGRTSDIEWLPDTFGYCASLPQILKHGGVRYFMTTKLNWNDTNVFPYDLFHWVGIDGTSMLSYLNHGVNEHTRTKDVHEHWQSYRQKAVHPEQMLLYGHGDGGGGVTREMVETIARSDLMVGQPASRIGTAADFFAGIGKRDPKLPKWQGDLYLELHRGTYTTHGRNKRHNRKAEALYREAELWHSLARPLLEESRDAELRSRLNEGWKLLLLNQFHDIIPGSAITEAYVTSEKEYGEIFAAGRSNLQTALETLAGSIDTSAGEGTPFVVFNGLGWERDLTIELPVEAGTCVQAFDGEGRRLSADECGAEEDLAAGADNAAKGNVATADGAASKKAAGILTLVPAVPAFGYKTIWLRTAEKAAEFSDDARRAEAEWLADGVWETAAYAVRFNERGEIVRLYDKAAEREVVLQGEAANRFCFFHDRPTLWDAWDIDDRYEEQPAGEAELLERTLVRRGRAADVLRFRWRVGRSEIEQDVIFRHADGRIDFKTRVRWNEAHKLLKVAFPIDVVADKATYEIPFGALERPTHRNTSWEQAQFEVCGHRFADVSEFGYGVSLLNDCKYGYDIQGSAIRLSLLRAPKWPDDTADLGDHEFTYSLYPHAGDWRAAHTARRAAELNADSAFTQTGRHPGSLPSEGSLLPFEGGHIVLDTVKPAEDGSGIVLRFYESAGGRGTAEFGWPHPYGRAVLSNALEDEGEELARDGERIQLKFAPYEIKTIKLLPHE
ncbi:alpha-mannosidase [Cohnella zeiphila]|uniref:alpha-mannosidase n=1 Tax=Cohnella zeiphila TaxID=2761120 RepID=A0A7X0SIH5_9BACL|nr:glycoside hydrolase family 38 C-terminal domain-containing protein [Cohnella zeiphila]MBB6730572.1 alpha-mannosidase [Cohnella zeiphila]